MRRIRKFFPNELPRRKQRGIKNFKFCHSALDTESNPVFWIPATETVSQFIFVSFRNDIFSNYDTVSPPE